MKKENLTGYTPFANKAQSELSKKQKKIWGPYVLLVLERDFITNKLYIKTNKEIGKIIGYHEKRVKSVIDDIEEFGWVKINRDIGIEITFLKTKYFDINHYKKQENMEEQNVTPEKQNVTPEKQNVTPEKQNVTPEKQNVTVDVPLTPINTGGSAVDKHITINNKQYNKENSTTVSNLISYFNSKFPNKINQNNTTAKNTFEKLLEFYSEDDIRTVINHMDSWSIEIKNKINIGYLKLENFQTKLDNSNATKEYATVQEVLLKKYQSALDMAKEETPDEDDKYFKSYKWLINKILGTEKLWNKPVMEYTEFLSVFRTAHYGYPTRAVQALFKKDSTSLQFNKTISGAIMDQAIKLKEYGY